MGIFNKYTPTSLEDMEEDVVVPQAETTVETTTVEATTVETTTVEPTTEAPAAE